MSQWHFLYFFPLPHQHGSFRPSSFILFSFLSALLQRLPPQICAISRSLPAGPFLFMPGPVPRRLWSGPQHFPTLLYQKFFPKPALIARSRLFRPPSFSAQSAKPAYLTAAAVPGKRPDRPRRIRHARGPPASAAGKGAEKGASQKQRALPEAAVPRGPAAAKPPYRLRESVSASDKGSF